MHCSGSASYFPSHKLFWRLQNKSDRQNSRQRNKRMVRISRWSSTSACATLIQKPRMLTHPRCNSMGRSNRRWTKRCWTDSSRERRHVLLQNGLSSVCSRVFLGDSRWSHVKVRFLSSPHDAVTVTRVRSAVRAARAAITAVTRTATVFAIARAAAVLVSRRRSVFRGTRLRRAMTVAAVATILAARASTRRAMVTTIAAATTTRAAFLAPRIFFLVVTCTGAITLAAIVLWRSVFFLYKNIQQGSRNC